MKKDKISFLILLVEIVAIVALHAAKMEPLDNASAPRETTRSTPLFSANTIHSSNSSYLILPVFPY